MNLRIPILILTLGLPLLLPAQYRTDHQRWEFFLRLAATHSPDAHEVLSEMRDEESKFAAYLDGATTVEGMMNEFDTFIHETTHGYEWKIEGATFMTTGYYIGPGTHVVVQRTPVYNSNELNRFVPDSLQEKIFRYGVYVGDKSNVSSQVHGIYGMLNEFSAYYHQTQFAADLRPWFEQRFGFSDETPWTDYYFNAMGNGVVAFYEFRLFMGWYLVYAKAHHPEMYEELMNNTQMRVAFTLLYRQFKSQADNYSNQLEYVTGRMQDAGLNASVEEGFLRVYDEGGGYTGSGVFTEEIAWLKTLFKGEVVAELKKFYLPEVTAENYLSYLEPARDE